jgi:protein gp37
VSAKTGIAWTDHTFNPWWGCTKVSPGCTNCYAERDSKRYGFKVWGPVGPTVERRVFGEKHWAEPLKWNREAEREGRSHRVFCASMADVFEADAPEGEQRRLFKLIEATPHLTWQLLTKRPELVLDVVPIRWSDGFPPNVWLGVSVEDQQRADERIPLLLQTPARVRFLSVEPLLGPVDLSAWLACGDGTGIGNYGLRSADLHWVICGGESGSGARPCSIEWIRSVLEQCWEAKVPAFCKQLGSLVAAASSAGHANGWAPRHGEREGLPLWGLLDKGGDPARWPLDLRVRQFPEVRP